MPINVEKLSRYALENIVLEQNAQLHVLKDSLGKSQAEIESLEGTIEELGERLMAIRQQVLSALY